MIKFKFIMIAIFIIISVSCFIKGNLILGILGLICANEHIDDIRYERLEKELDILLNKRIVEDNKND